MQRVLHSIHTSPRAPASMMILLDPLTASESQRAIHGNSLALNTVLN